MATLRAIGPFNGTMPQPTGMVVGFMRDPKANPHTKYCQYVPAPEVIFDYCVLNADEPTRMVDLNKFAWGYDDYRPSGRDFVIQAKWEVGRTTRWDFPYQIGETTIRTWQKSGVNPKQLYDQVRASQAALHRSQRVVTALTGATWTGYTSDLNTLLGSVGAGFDTSSGEELISGAANPNFQIIKRAFNAVKRRIHLATNGAVHGSELVCVMSPVVAQAIAVSGEMVNFLKQSTYAKELTNPNLEDWSLPDSYGGFKLVVEDTPRCYINHHADGTVADVTVASNKDYILNTDSVYFVSRSGGLDGGYGYQNFSTVQLYHFKGEARVEAFSEPKHELVEGHVVMEDSVQVPAVLSGYRLTDVLTT